MVGVQEQIDDIIHDHIVFVPVAVFRLRHRQPLFRLIEHRNHIGNLVKGPLRRQIRQEHHHTEIQDQKRQE